MSQGNTVDSISGDRGRRLPEELAGNLEPAARHALDHPLRRRILRTANGGGPRTPAEIAASWANGTSLSLISYHAQVLESYGGPELAGDPEVASVLKATEALDRT